MKKFLLAIIALCFAAAQVSAQCSPNLSLTSPGIWPDSATGLAHGVVGQSYSDTLQFRVPPDTTVSSITVTINWIRIDSIAGLPAGFTWTTSECGVCAAHSFNGNTNGCLLISGPSLSTAATYPLTVYLTDDGTSPFGHVTLPDSNKDYRIVIDPQAGIQVYNANVFDMFQNYPNPLNTQTEINFTVPASAKADFRVYDLLGREIITRSIDAVTGVNKITLSARYFKPGIYFYKLVYKNKSLTRKMIVTAKP